MIHNTGSRTTRANGRSNDKAGVSPLAIVLAIASLLAFLAWMGYRYLGPAAPISNELTQKHDDYWNALAKQSGGNFTRLSPVDQQKINNETLGHGVEAMKGYAKDHGFAK